MTVEYLARVSVVLPGGNEHQAEVTLTVDRAGPDVVLWGTDATGRRVLRLVVSGDQANLTGWHLVAASLSRQRCQEVISVLGDLLAP